MSDKPFHKEVITEFYEYVDKINNKPFDKIHEGYLIKSIEFNRFKDKKIQKLNSVNAENLLELLNKGYQFQIINNELRNNIPNQNLENTLKIKYVILPDTIILLLKDNNYMEFKNKRNNIISKSLFIKSNNININPNNNINKNVKIYDSEYLKHLIRNIYFINEIQSTNYIFKNKFTRGFIINKKIISMLNEKFKLKEIKAIIDKNFSLEKISYQNFDEQFHKISQFLNQNLPNYINNIKSFSGEITFKKSESNLIPKYLNINQKKLTFIDDFEIIDEKFGKFLQKICKENSPFPEIYFCTIDNKIFHTINPGSDNIYQIVKFNSNNICVTEYLIEFISNKISSLNDFNKVLLKFVVKKGIQNLISLKNPIKTENDNIVFNLHPIYKSDSININDKLKALILLIISEYNLYDNKLHKVYLINPLWLEQYKYREIKNLIDEKIKEILNLNINFNDLNSVSTILNYLNKEEIKKIDNYLINYKIESNIPFISYIQNFKTHGKNILYFKNFILIDERMLIHLQKYFGINATNYDTSFIQKKGEGDIIILKNNSMNIQHKSKNEENLIIFGKYDNKCNIYNTQYIFDYYKTNILEAEIPFILNHKINDYIKEKTCIDDKNYTSPIFVNNQKIGNFYKLVEGFDYTKCINYSNYLKNEKITKAIYLYANEVHIKQKIESKNFDDEEFYMVKKKYISDLKTEINYNQLKKYFIGKINNIQPNIKEKYNIIKNLSQSDLQLLNNNNNIIHNNNKNTKKISEINVNEIKNPINPLEIYMLANDFELIEKNCAMNLLKNNDKISFHEIKCSFYGKYIIFHYPRNKFNNMYYICTISKLNENNDYINEYIFKYKDQESYKFHLEQIKKCDLNKYLQSLNFINNISRIINSENIELGIIIKLLEQSKLDSTLCYKNVILQCLISIKEFSDYFQNNRYINDIIEKDSQKEKLCSYFKLLIENSNHNKNNNKNLFSPSEFKNKISKNNPIFQEIKSNDLKDLINYLLTTLHHELNKVSPKLINKNNNILDRTNKDLMFNNYISNFTNINRSIISDLFFAVNYKCIKCDNCKTKSYIYQTYNSLVFSIEEIIEYNLKSFKNEIGIIDCFEYTKRNTDIMKNVYCSFCKKSCNSYISTNITTGPEILIITLNWGKEIHSNLKLKFDDDLDLSDYVELKNTGYKYELFGVINNKGKNDLEKYFIAYYKEYENNQWLKYDDTIVSKVDDFKKEVIDSGLPYLLFFKKNK